MDTTTLLIIVIVLLVLREARKEITRHEGAPSTVKCKVNCREGFWITMTGN